MDGVWIAGIGTTDRGFRDRGCRRSYSRSCSRSYSCTPASSGNNTSMKPKREKSVMRDGYKRPIR